MSVNGAAQTIDERDFNLTNSMQVGDFGLLDSDDWVPPIYDEVVAYLAGHWFTGSTLNPFEQSHAILVRYPY